MEPSYSRRTVRSAIKDRTKSSAVSGDNLKPTSRNISVHCSTSKRPSSTSRRLEKTAKTSSGIASTIAAG